VKEIGTEGKGKIHLCGGSLCGGDRVYVARLGHEFIRGRGIHCKSQYDVENKAGKKAKE